MHTRIIYVLFRKSILDLLPFRLIFSLVLFVVMVW